MTVSGSSSMMTLTSERTSPRPSEIFCLPSAVSPDARRPSIALEIEHARRSPHTLDWMSASGRPRLRSGKARLSRTVIVS